MPFRFAESERNGLSRIEMQQSVLILDSILDSREDRELSVALLLKGTVIIFVFTV